MQVLWLFSGKLFLQAPSVRENWTCAPSTGGYLWVWDLLVEREEPFGSLCLGQTLTLAQSLPPVLRYLLAPKSLVDGEAAVVVHGEQNDLARVVEPGGSGHIHPPLLGGHDRCHCVACQRKKQDWSLMLCAQYSLPGFGMGSNQA